METTTLSDWPLTVFCDFDGPIVDVSERYYNTYCECLSRTRNFFQQQGECVVLNQLSKEEFWRMKCERCRDEEIALCSGLREHQIPFFFKAVRETVNQPDLLGKDRLHYGVNWALALLHSRGVRLVLVTLRCCEQVEQILCNYGLLRLFSGIYGSDDCRVAYSNNSERKIELMKQAVNEMAIDRARAYSVGDTEADILAARAAGIKAIALTCGIRSRHYLQQFEPDGFQSDLLCCAHELLKKAEALREA